MDIKETIKTQFKSGSQLRGAVQYFGLFALAAAVANAAPSSIDLGFFRDTAISLKGLFLLVGAIGCVGALGFSIFKFVGGDMMKGFTFAGGAVAGGAIIGYASDWGSALTGQSV